MNRVAGMRLSEEDFFSNNFKLLPILFDQQRKWKHTLGIRISVESAIDVGVVDGVR